VNHGLLRQLLDAVAAILLLLPLLALTRAGYDRQLWSRRTETNILPFAAPWTVRVPLAVWYLAFWTAALFAAGRAASQGRAAYLGMAFVLVEAAYYLARLGRKIEPLSPASTLVVAFALGHNALTEELIFRGVPLGLAAIGGFSESRLWQYGFVAASAVAFGIYHRLVNGRSRFYDTALFGCVLAAVAVWDNVASAILVHFTHNALSVPLRQSPETMARWRLVRLLYLIGLCVVACAGIILDAGLVSGMVR